MSSSTDAPPPITFLPTGALIHTFHVGGRNIVLSLPSPTQYPSKNTAFFGETIGRVANRVAAAEITNLNGRSYPLPANEDGVNTLHGGDSGWGKKEWEGPRPVWRNEREEVVFKYVGADGEEGLPGKVEGRVFYWVGRKGAGEGRGKEEEITLEIEYEIEMIGDEEGVEETCVNVTNHSYFNLSQAPTITSTTATFPSTLHQPISDTSIPTGDLTPFPGLIPDQAVTFTETSPEIDHCFIIDDSPASIPIDTRSRPLRTAVTLYHPDTAITLLIETTEPAFQFYTGEGVDVPALEGEDGTKAGPWGPRAGIAIEPSRYVNAINVPEWRGMVVLKRGQVWGSKSRYTAWV